jgi:type II secretory pathway pseudopilin PulG
MKLCFNKKKRYTVRGYTMLEILVVIGLLFIISMFAISISIPQVRDSEISSTVNGIESEIFSAQQRAYSGRDGKSYGVRIVNGEYISFIGDSYAAAEATDSFDIPGGVTVSSINLDDGGDEIVFLSGELKPNTSGTITFSDDSNSYVVEINSQGLVDSYKL